MLCLRVPFAALCEINFIAAMQHFSHHLVAKYAVYIHATFIRNAMTRQKYSIVSEKPRFLSHFMLYWQ